MGPPSKMSRTDIARKPFGEIQNTMGMDRRGSNMQRGDKKTKMQSSMGIERQGNLQHHQDKETKVVRVDRSEVRGAECILSVRSMRLGSYSVVPVGQCVTVSKTDIKFSVPAIKQEDMIVPLTIPLSDLGSVKMFFEEREFYAERASSVLFLYPGPQTCSSIRSSLGMRSRESFYLDPSSTTKSEQGLILNLGPGDKEEVEQFLSTHMKADEVDPEEVNSLVIAALPRDQEFLLRKFSPGPSYMSRPSNSESSTSSSSRPVYSGRPSPAQSHPNQQRVALNLGQGGKGAPRMSYQPVKRNYDTISL